MIGSPQSYPFTVFVPPVSHQLPPSTAFDTSPEFTSRVLEAEFEAKYSFELASQVVLVVKNPPANSGDIRDVGSIPGLGRSWRREWQPSSVFLPGEYHGQRSLVGYSP